MAVNSSIITCCVSGAHSGQPYHISRSRARRAYRKNDNRFVEQKNDTLTVMRLAEKIYVTEENGTARLIRRYDEARTPFDRLRATSACIPEQVAILERRCQQTNPRQLRRDIYASIERLFALPGASADGRESIFDTLFFPNGHLSTNGTECGHMGNSRPLASCPYAHTRDYDGC